MNLRATIAILTFNGEEYLEDLLDKATSQRAPFGFEVLVIDSGSTDRTLEIVRRNPGIRLHQIPNEEFGHGRTRNLAAQLANGEFMVFLTQDAVPAHPGWLEQMLRPFEMVGEQLACVFGKQVPRGDCCPTVKRELHGFFGSFGHDHCVSLQYRNPWFGEDQAIADAVGFFSDVNSAVRRSLLLEMPYEDVDYAEDQVFGRAVVAAGMIKAYAPLGSVYHSHSYPPATYVRRMYDEFVGLRRLTGAPVAMPIRELMLGWIRPTVGDWRFVLRDATYSRKAKVKWMVLAPVYNIGRRTAIRLASRERSSRLDQWLSLERRARESGKRSTTAPAGSTSAERS